TRVAARGLAVAVAVRPVVLAAVPAVAWSVSGAVCLPARALVAHVIARLARLARLARVRLVVRGLCGAARERDRVLRGHAVEQVQVRQCLQAASGLPAERARRVVLLRAGNDARVPGQGLRGRQVTAG